MSSKKILVIPGDGIGPEVTNPSIQVLKKLASQFDIQLELSEKLVGGAGSDGVLKNRVRNSWNAMYEIASNLSLRVMR